MNDIISGLLGGLSKALGLFIIVVIAMAGLVLSVYSVAYFVVMH